MNGPVLFLVHWEEAPGQVLELGLYRMLFTIEVNFWGLLVHHPLLFKKVALLNMAPNKTLYF